MTPERRDLVALSINGRTVQAEKGRLLIDVAEEMGIFVPRFCYHPGMKSVAVCRMCLVHIEGQRKLMPACATPVDDGMKVDTAAEDAVDAQRGMLEFLLINHPLDCPICDRGGECPLQDQTLMHGPGSSRYVEPKRTYVKALEISDLVVLDRERCVLCWRCVRFSEEVAGDAFIQLVDRGPGTQILTFSEEPFNSYFSGNTIQICPVGALTAKTYRFVSRPWDLEGAPSVCGYCSVGCPLTNEARAGKLVRCQALPNEKVNDFWICDKGRFAFHYVSSPERLTTPLLREGSDGFRETSWPEALRAVAEKVGAGRRVGVLAGGHLTTEDAYAIGRLSKKVIGTRDVDSRIQDAGAPYELARGVAGAAGSSAELDDLDRAATIVWVGPEPKEALPVLYLRLRRAVLEKKTALVAVSVRALSLDDFATRVVRCEAGGEAAALDSLGEDLEGPLVVCWGPSSPGRDESSVLRSAVELARRAGAKMLLCPPHAGSQGMIDMGVHPSLDAGYAPASDAGRDTRGILEAAAAGELDALLLFGADPIADFPDRELARRALENAKFTAVVEILPTESLSYADVVLPSTAYAERDGTFTNLERRLQKLEPLIVRPGTSREPWRICAGIAAELGQEWGWTSYADVWDDIRNDVPTHAGVDLAALAPELPTPSPVYETGFASQERIFPNSELGPAKAVVAGPGGQYPKGYRGGAPFQTGQNWPLSWELRAFEAKQRPGYVPPLPEEPRRDLPAEGEPPAPRREEDGRFVLYTGRMIYDQGAMVSRTAILREIQKKPFVEMNGDDARGLGIDDGDEVVVSNDGVEARGRAVVGDIARGAVFIPYDQDGLAANNLMRGWNPTVKVAKP